MHGLASPIHYRLLSINSQSEARRIVDAGARGQAFLSFTPLAHIAIRANGLAPGLTSKISHA